MWWVTFFVSVLFLLESLLTFREYDSNLSIALGSKLYMRLWLGSVSFTSFLFLSPFLFLLSPLFFVSYYISCLVVCISLSLCHLSFCLCRSLSPFIYLSLTTVLHYNNKIAFHPYHFTYSRTFANLQRFLSRPETTRKGSALYVIHSCIEKPVITVCEIQCFSFPTVWTNLMQTTLNLQLS